MERAQKTLGGETAPPGRAGRDLGGGERRRREGPPRARPALSLPLPHPAPRLPGPIQPVPEWPQLPPSSATPCCPGQRRPPLSRDGKVYMLGAKLMGGLSSYPLISGECLERERKDQQPQQARLEGDTLARPVGKGKRSPGRILRGAPEQRRALRCGEDSL